MQSTYACTTCQNVITGEWPSDGNCPTCAAVIASKFKKFDQDKPKIGLLPHEALLGAAEVMTYGAVKYAAHNWRQGTEWSRYYDAALRHLLAWNLGEDVDSETGASHLDHATCCILMLSSLAKTAVGTDDRYKKEET